MIWRFVMCFSSLTHTVLAALRFAGCGGLTLLVWQPGLETGFAQNQNDASLLPFITSDAVLQRDLLSGQILRKTGVIEDLSGDTVHIRRGGGTRVERYRLRDVVEIQFLKSPAFDQGLLHLQQGEWQQALPDLESALSTEQRVWVQREIHAAAAEALLASGRYTDVVARIQKIVETDPVTRHVGLLPLVWDDGLPVEDRFPADAAAFTSPSPLLQLVTASVLLDQPMHEATASMTLTKLRVESRPQLRELAEAQLWRLRILHPEQLKKIDTELWSDRVREFGRDIRSGPEFVLGRALMLQHNYDDAAIHLMWPAVMRNPSPQLIRSSLQAAAEALHKSGRPEEAALALQQLAARFPEEPAAVPHAPPETN